MENEKQYPLWVRLGLTGATKKGNLVIVIVIMVVLTMVTFGNVIYLNATGQTIKPGKMGIGILLLLGSLLYYFTLRWVSQNGNWEEAEIQKATLKESGMGFLIMLGVMAIVIAITKGLNYLN